MILRILGEGTFDVPDEAMASVARLYRELRRVVARHDDAAFASLLSALLTDVRLRGTSIASDDVGPCDLLLPGESEDVGGARIVFEVDDLARAGIVVAQGNGCRPSDPLRGRTEQYREHLGARR